MTLAIAFLLFAGFVAVFLVDRRRKRHQAAVPIQQDESDIEPTESTEDPEPDATWPPSR